MSTIALFTRGHIRKQSKCPLTNEWIRKKNVYINGINVGKYTHIHTLYSGTLYRLKKKEILLFTPICINLEDIMLSEINQS